METRGLVDVPGPEVGRSLGVVAPFDLALDRELWRWVPDGVSLLVTRTHFLDVPVSVAMAEELNDDAAVRQATRDLMTVEPEVVAYACTSATFVGGLAGEEAVRAAMRAGGARVAITTSGALLEALSTLGVRRVAVATPYLRELNDRLRSFLAEAGVETVADSFLGLTGSIWRVPYVRVAELVIAADSPDADAIFVSCTNLPTYDLIAPLEEALGKPVVTANQATMWSALRALGSRAVGPGQRLLEETGPWSAFPGGAVA